MCSSAQERRFKDRHPAHQVSNSLYSLPNSPGLSHVGHDNGWLLLIRAEESQSVAHDTSTARNPSLLASQQMLSFVSQYSLTRLSVA
jgi:hypothetical protein